MATVTSPALHRGVVDDPDGCNLISDDGRPWFCIAELAELCLLPKEAKTFWVDAQTEQWPDENGRAVRVRGGGTFFPEWYDENLETWRLLWGALMGPLKKLVARNTPATVYVRVRHEE